MLTSLQQAKSPDLETLIEAAHNYGIRVWWRHLHGLDGAWSAQHRSIWVRPDLTTWETRALLAHELGHAYLNHEGPQSPAAEQQAWAYAGRLLIPDHDYAAAAATHGDHVGNLATELDTTREVVLGYQSLLTR